MLKVSSAILTANVWPPSDAFQGFSPSRFLCETSKYSWNPSFKISEAEVSFPLETYFSSSSFYWRHHYLPRYAVRKPPRHLMCFHLFFPLTCSFISASCQILNCPSSQHLSSAPIIFIHTGALFAVTCIGITDSPTSSIYMRLLDTVLLNKDKK